MVSQQTWHDLSILPPGQAQHTANTHSLFPCILTACLYSVLYYILYFGDKFWGREQFLLRIWGTEGVLILK